MRFELEPTYPDWPENDRKTLHVDGEAMQAIRDGGPLPLDVMRELKKAMYHEGLGRLAAMDVVVDLGSDGESRRD